MMRRVHAFLYASLVYGAIGMGIWWLYDRPSAISEAYQSTTVTLVSPDETFEEARQMVNAEASEASRAEEKPREETPQPPDEAEAPPPPPEERSVSETPPEASVPEPPQEREAPEPSSEVSDPPPETPPEAPSAEMPTPPVESENPSAASAKLAPLEPVDPKLAQELKRPLTPRELASCCPTPVKKVPKKPTRHESKRRAKRSRKKVSHSSSAHRASARSRARRGGSRNVNRLLAQIKRRIARNKSYPPAARRRRMQGTVRVSFTITRSGGVRGIRVSGPGIFARSARTAVRRAFPVSVQGAAFALPKRMTVTLRYRLR